MTRGEFLRFQALFNGWASSDTQMRTKNGDFGDGTQHQFITELLTRREEIIRAVEQTVK